ncbi:MAG: lipocalin family protein [Luteimonas sp.]
MRRALIPAALAALLAGNAGCAPAAHGAAADGPIPPVRHVDIQRYMGRWYVIASIPTAPERGAHNPVETYRLQRDGTICTSFRFRPDGFDAPVKQIRSVASVVDGSGGGEWRVHLLGVLRLQYLVAWVSPDYSQVIVARDKRDHAWLMARTPSVPEADYRAMLQRLGGMGYDLSQVVRAPQHWPEIPAQPGSFELRCD